MIVTGKHCSTRREIFTSATVSTTNPTWPDPESNHDLRDMNMYRREWGFVDAKNRKIKYRK
jgi:hypothetical protein